MLSNTDEYVEVISAAVRKSDYVKVREIITRLIIQGMIAQQKMDEVAAKYIHKPENGK